MPRYLTLGAVAVAVWVIVFADEISTGALPAAIVLAAGIVDYREWTRRGRPWHDWTVIVLLLPAIASAVWIGIGGLATGVERSDSERLAFEVGPGIALTGLLCTLISYHGRHHPDERRG
jgi:hypothetical protein